MEISHMTFAVNSNAVSWGLASVHTRALRMANNDSDKMKRYREKGLIDVSPAITTFMNKYKKYINTGRLVHEDGSNFFGGIIGLSSISQTPEFKTRVKSILKFEYGFSDEEIQEADRFIVDLVNLSKAKDIKRIVDDTEGYKNSIERLWRLNEKRVIKYVTEILGYEPESVRKSLYIYHVS